MNLKYKFNTYNIQIHTMSFITTTNKQKNRMFIRVPVKELSKIQEFQGGKIKVIIDDPLTKKQIIIISQIITQGKNRTLEIYAKYLKDFDNFIGHDLKVTLEKI